jgi:hypothetical protein
MILKFKTGRGSRGILNYISAGAGQAEPLFTNMAGKNPRELAREVAALRSLRPNLGKAAGHLIIAHDSSQRPLSQGEWREALEIALAEHGATGVPYAAYMHEEGGGGRHLHCFLPPDRCNRERCE